MDFRRNSRNANTGKAGQITRSEEHSSDLIRVKGRLIVRLRVREKGKHNGWT